MAGALLLSSAVAALIGSALPAQNTTATFEPPPDKIVIEVATVSIFSGESRG